MARPQPAQERTLPAVDAPSSDAQPVEDTKRLPYWSQAKSRAFLASTVDLGFSYFRPTLSAGYGRPHSQWAGLDAETRFSASWGAEYVGARITSPHVGLRGGMRYLFTTSQPYLREAPSYTSDDVVNTTEPRAHYATAEAEIEGQGAFSVRETDSLGAAEAIMRSHRVRRLPVVDEADRPIGMLSMSDLARQSRALPRGTDGLTHENVVRTLAAVSEPPREAKAAE